MMGQLPAKQNNLFYDFCLEQHIPDDHLLRRIDQFLDFDQIRQHLTPYYSHTGRPSIDPELMIRMLLVGYCYGIRSERQLCDEVNFNLAYRWFCRLGLEQAVPDHSSFSKNRHGRFRDADLLRLVFNTVVQRCIEEGLVGSHGFAIDASFIRADVARQRYEHSPVNWTPDKVQSRAVKEYLDLLDQDEQLRRPQKSISLTDPNCQWTGAKGPANFFYSTNYLIDVDHNIIMDVEASPSTKLLEVDTTKTMVQRVEDHYGLRPQRLMGDTAYGTADVLGFLVNNKQIEPHVPVHDRSQRKDNTFSREDFTYIAEDDEYECPRGKRLTGSGRPNAEHTLLYLSRHAECRVCPDKPRCCPNTKYRKIPRSVNEAARDLARTITASNLYTNITSRQRKKVEMLFAHMKRQLNFTRLRLRGLKSANDECVLVATAQNLRRLAKLCGQPPPDHRIGATG